MSDTRDTALSLMPKIKELDAQYNETGKDPDKLIDDFNNLVAQTAAATGVSEFDLHLEIEEIETENKWGTKMSDETQEPEEVEEKDFNDLYEEWTKQKKIYRWEGEAGVENFEKLTKAIGYEGSVFRFGSPIESFLCDNPGAIEALIEWIVEQGESSPEWRANLESELEEEEDDDD